MPGQGKSALLAKLHQQLRDSPHFVITHFVGATERSASAYSLVQRLLDEVDRSGIAWPPEQTEGQEPKRDFNSLCLQLALRLGDYSGERRILILLDALNQLSDEHVSVHDHPVGFNPPAAVEDDGAVTVSVRSFDSFGDIHFHGQNQAKAVST